MALTKMFLPTRFYYSNNAGDPRDPPRMPERSIPEPGDGAYSFTVTALQAVKYGEQNPVRAIDDVFSEGPGPLLPKPDITAPTLLSDSSPNSPFKGTSAATAVAGGAAVLLKALNPGLGPSAIDLDMRTKLCADLGDPGHDNQFGYGKLLLPAVLPYSWNPSDCDDDGVVDPADNCDCVANAGQEDTDNDLIGDVCDFTCGSGDSLTVTAVTPDRAGRGAPFRVEGTGFASDAHLFFDDIEVPIAVVAPTYIDATVPQGMALGDYTVTVTRDDGCVSAGDVLFTVVQGGCGLTGVEPLLVVGWALMRRRRTHARA